MADAPPPPYSALNEPGKPGPYPPSQGGYGPPPAGYGAPPPAGYPPPQPGMYPAGAYPPPGHVGTSTNTVVVTQPTIAIAQTFGEAPVRTQCHYCRADIVTATYYEAGSFSWLICVILCIVGCQLGCCLIPFCMEGCQDVIHTCPNCRQIISRYSRM